MLRPKPINEVIKTIESRFSSLRVGVETVSYLDALGRVLAVNIEADSYLPRFNRATVDGYAVIAADIASSSTEKPVNLECIGETRMGEHTLLQLKSGQCAYVPTGGEIPDGADTMIMVEATRNPADGTIAFYESAPAGMNMIFRGEDTQPGQLIIPAGKRLKIADIGTLAAMGIVSVPVMKKPRVGIISTGDEIIPAEQTLSAGLIRDANTPMLRNAVLVNGGEPADYGIVKDDFSLVKQTAQQALAENDLLLISGGTSMDSRDAVEAIIEDMGEVIQHGVLLKPGKPTIFGCIEVKPVFGLPGNPVSVYFTFHLFVRPLLHTMQGTRPIDRKIIAKLARAVVTNSGREEYIPVILEGALAHPVASKSGLITTVSCADGYIRVPRELPGLEAGAEVEVTFLDR
jgi:molybdopterin molybdotransferase